LIVAAGAALILGALGTGCRDQPVGPTADPAAVQATADVASVHLEDGLGARIIRRPLSSRSPGPKGWQAARARVPLRYGVYLAYAIARDETRQPVGRRSVKGIIPVDDWVGSGGFRTSRALSLAAVGH
jgi:hypothetical protein